MKEIPLTKSMVAIVDDDDYDRLITYEWQFEGRYAALSHWGGGSKIYMHNMIIDEIKGLDVDHINGNKLDNRKENLRMVTRSVNNQSRGKQNNNTSGYLGVCFRKKNQKFTAQIAKDGIIKYIGIYKTAEEAARAYDKKALELYGLQAKLNFPLAVEELVKENQ